MWTQANGPVGQEQARGRPGAGQEQVRGRPGAGQQARSLGTELVRFGRQSVARAFPRGHREAFGQTGLPRKPPPLRAWLLAG